MDNTVHNLSKFFIINISRISSKSCHNNIWLFFSSQFFEGHIINSLCFWVHSILDCFPKLSRGRYFMSMRQVASIRKRHAHNSSSQRYEAKIDSEIRRRTRESLNINAPPKGENLKSFNARALHKFSILSEISLPP